MSEDAVVDKVSWRSAGTRKAGSLVLSRHGPVAPSKPSIPSSLQTILHRDTLNTRPGGAFGVQSSRFSRGTASNPGPGEYQHVPQREWEHNPSYSKKGLGNGFVSKVQRSLLGGNVLSPGPAAYGRLYDDTSAQGGAGGVRPGGSVFGRDHSLRSGDAYVRKIKSEAAPGPGSYDDASLGTIGSGLMRAPDHPSAAFSSGTTRDVEIRARKDNPGPGHYNPQQLASRSGIIIHRPVSPVVAPTPSAAAPIAVRSELPISIDTVIDGVQRAAGTSKLTPGPGYYKPDVEFGQKRFDTRARSARRRPFTGIRDVPARAINPAEKQTPGPGYYNIDESSSPKARIATSAVFRDKTERVRPLGSEHAPPVMASSKVKAPGPAFYNPNGSARKSFHLNSSGSWV